MKQINIKVDVPEGFVLDKIETEGDNIVAFVKEKEKFKRGDIVATHGGECIVMVEKFYGNNEVQTIVSLNESRLFQFRVGFGNYREWRLATPSEQQILFDALAKEGKKWNPETLQIEDIEKDILVPEGIGIYRCKENFGCDADGLYLSFNNRKQLLYFNDKYQTYGVCPLHSGFEPIQCKLTPCKQSDLKVGDTAFAINTKEDINRCKSFLSHYVKIFNNDDKHCFVSEDEDIATSSIKYKFWYKVEPITK